MSADYFASLPASVQMKLRKAAWECLGLRSIPDRDTLLRLLAIQTAYGDVLEAHAEWLRHARQTVLDRGESWTPAALQQYAIAEAVGDQ